MQRNSIHDIKPSSRLRQRGHVSRRVTEEHDEPIVRVSRSRGEDYDNPYIHEKKSGGRAIWYVAAFCVLFLIFAISFLFAGATVEITPRMGVVEVDKIITARKNPLDSKSLSFNMVALEGEESLNVSGNSEKKYVEKKAVGMVRIFNNHSSASQNLLIDTRLETEDGKIYKTQRAVSVPGQRSSGGETVPGSVDVEVYADVPGEEYNKKEADLKILGFKGSPKYDTIYARALTQIEGGFKGDTYVVSEEEEGKQKDLLTENLRQNLLSKAHAELPEGFVIYDNATVLKTDSPEIIAGAGNDELIIKQKGILYAFVFKKDLITKSMIDGAIADLEENPVYLPDLENVSVDLLSKGEINPTEVDSINLSVKDSVSVIWKIDESSLQESLVGVKKRRFEQVLATFKNIDRAELSLKPFWKTSFPDKKDQIKIINTSAL